MSMSSIREQLHEQIEQLPDEMVEQIADFTLFLIARRQVAPTYDDWDQKQWQAFVVEQFLREGDEVEYSLDDAEEVYRS